MKRDPLQQNSTQWLKLCFGLIVIFALFQWIAETLRSHRGEFGIVVGLIVVVAILIVERLLFTNTLAGTAKAIGLGQPKALGMILAIAIAILMGVSTVIFAWQTGTTFTLFSNWQLLLIGLFFQAGIAEETLFRGYLYGFFRRRNRFLRAAALSALPFVAVHFVMFLTMDWMIASASVGLAVVTTFPLSRLFDLGGSTIWAPAIVHFVVQAGVKLLVAQGESASLYPFFWMILCAVIPLSVFLVPCSLRHPAEC